VPKWELPASVLLRKLRQVFQQPVGGGALGCGRVYRRGNARTLTMHALSELFQCEK